ncbi:MAG: MFS transporter [Bacteroidales bacterium]|nr:MFS transporter [Bacteroidales bacterium]
MNTRELKRSVLFIAAFSAYITPFMGAAINLALPSIGSELEASAKQLNWVVTAYLLGTAVFMLPFGRLGDILGRKKIFISGLILFTIITACIAFTGNIRSFLIFRVLQGISSAMIFGTSMAIITSVFPPGERGRAMGINITATYAGLSSGPFLGGLLTEYFGWRSIFAFIIPISATAAYLTYRKIRMEWSEAKGEKLDIPGSVLLGGGLVLVILGFSRIPGATGIILITAGLLMILSFFIIEWKARFPLLDIKLLTSNRVFSFSNLAAMIHYAATSGIGFFMSLYLQYIKGLDARTAGFIIMTQPVMMALFSVPAGKLSDERNPGHIASAGIAMTSLGIFALTFIQQSTSLLYIISILAFNGLGYAFFSSPNSNAIMSSVEKKHLGVASGMVGTMRLIGQTTSLGIAMMLISLNLGDQAINPENYDQLLKTIRTGLSIFAVICIPAIFASLARNKKLNKRNYE